MAPSSTKWMAINIEASFLFVPHGFRITILKANKIEDIQPFFQIEVGS